MRRLGKCTLVFPLTSRCSRSKRLVRAEGQEILRRQAGGKAAQGQRGGVVRLGDLPHQRKTAVFLGKEDDGPVGLPHHPRLGALVEKAQVAVVEEVMPRHQLHEGIIHQFRGAAAFHGHAQARQHRLHGRVPEAAQVAGDRRPARIAV